MSKDWKKRLGVVYSTNPDFKYQKENHDEAETLPIDKQNLRIVIDRKQRKGKVVTIIQGFVGTEDDLKALGRKLKTRCGVGGTVKEGEILIQGDLKEKINKILKQEGYSIK